MKQGVVRFALLVLVIGWVAAIMGPLALGGSDSGEKAPRPDPTRLWSAFPLYPRELPRPTYSHELPRPARPAASVAAIPRASAPDTFKSPTSALLLLICVPLGFSLLLLAIAAAPAWALPAMLLNLVGEGRVDLAVAGAAIALGVGVGVAVALVGS